MRRRGLDLTPGTVDEDGRRGVKCEEGVTGFVVTNSALIVTLGRCWVSPQRPPFCPFYGS